MQAGSFFSAPYLKRTGQKAFSTAEGPYNSLAGIQPERGSSGVRPPRPSRLASVPGSVQASQCAARATKLCHQVPSRLHFGAGPSAWLPPGLRAGELPHPRFADRLWSLCSSCLSWATLADMFAKAFRVKSNTAIKGSDR